jgi:hypothetical protein
MTSPPTKLERWSLLGWTLVACVAFMQAEPPPDPPAMTQEEIGAIDRGLAKIVATTRQWQQERGDLRIPWADAKGHLAIVIDDVGRELHLFEQLLALRHPLTFSILPGAVYAAGVQLRLRADRRRPRDAMLHLPMEPIDAAQMTTGAEVEEDFLRIGDDAQTMRGKLERALSRVPTAIGVNNHMGSRASADCAAMDALMPTLRDRGVFWLDSRTTARTCGERSAIAHGVRAVSRQVFLDDDPSPEAIAEQLARAVALSRTRPVIAIGHPSAALLEVLRRELPRLHAEGIAIVGMGELLAATDGPSDGAVPSGTSAAVVGARAPAPGSAALPDGLPPGPAQPDLRGTTAALPIRRP